MSVKFKYNKYSKKNLIKKQNEIFLLTLNNLGLFFLK